MAHFARINEDSRVIDVLPVDNANCGGGNFPESEPVGNEFLNSHGFPGVWKQTSYNNSFRYNFACNDMLYDTVKDAFYSTTSPGPGWTFNEATLRWVGP